MKNNNTEQKFFQIYLDTEDIVNLLSDEDRGKLFSLLYRFAIDGETPEINDNPALAIAFKVFTAQIARDFAVYERKVNTARENGKKGGGQKGNTNAKKNKKPKIEYSELNGDLAYVIVDLIYFEAKKTDFDIDYYLKKQQIAALAACYKILDIEDIGCLTDYKTI